MSDLVESPADDTPDAWTRRNFAPVVAVVIRAVRDPALAFDLATELMAVAALHWDRYPAVGSRMAWVLGFAPALVTRALDGDRVPRDERMRNRPRLEPRTLTDEYREWLRRLVDEPLDLDPEARRAAARLEREAPPPDRIRRVALSPLIRLEGAREHS
jgi:hypothetical protein